MNGNGTAVMSGLSVDTTNLNLANNVAYSLQLNPGGSWSQPTLITTGPGLVDTSGGLFVVGLNKLNQALLWTGYPNQDYGALLYNVSTHTLTDMSSLAVLSNSPISTFLQSPSTTKGASCSTPQTSGVLPASPSTLYY